MGITAVMYHQEGMMTEAITHYAQVREREILHMYFMEKGGIHVCLICGSFVDQPMLHYQYHVKWDEIDK